MDGGITSTVRNVNFVMVGKPTMIGRMSKACSRADMLSMVGAEDGKILKGSAKL